MSQNLIKNLIHHLNKKRRSEIAMGESSSFEKMGSRPIVTAVFQSRYNSDIYESKFHYEKDTSLRHDRVPQ